MLEITEDHVAPVNEPSSEDEVGRCFSPFIPTISVNNGYEPGYSGAWVQSLLIKYGRTNPEPSGTSLPLASQSAGEIETGTATSEALITPVETPLAPPREATALEIFTWVKRCVQAQTHLPKETAELVSFWAISTWFQEPQSVRPCLVISGPIHEGMVLLDVLSRVCRAPVKIAGFRRRDLQSFNRGRRTALICEPNLNKKDAALLGNLTTSGFLVPIEGDAADYSMSRAIYTGENPTGHKLHNSIHIHISTSETNAPALVRPEWLTKTTERLPVHLDQYRNRYLAHATAWTYVPSGMSSEAAAVAEPLLRCLVNAPNLREQLVTLLKAEDQLHLAETSVSAEAVVLEATLALSRDGRKDAYAREIAAEANRLLEARNEPARLIPANVGHQLKKLGLRTRRLSQSGNGLTFNKATVAEIQRLSAVYGMEAVSV